MGRGSNKTNSDKLADQLQDERYSLEQETGILTGMRVASGETVSTYLAVDRGARARSSERLDFSPGWTRPRWFVVTEGGPLSRAVTAQSRANQEDDEGPR